MQGIAIQSTKDKFKVIFDKKYYDESTVSSWLNYIEIEFLAQKIDFDKGILELGKEIKSSIWKEEKKRLGISN